MEKKATAKCTLPVEGIEVEYRRPTVGLLRRIQKTMPMIATAMETAEGKTEEVAAKFTWEDAFDMIKALSISPKFVVFGNDVDEDDREVRDGEYDLDDLDLVDFNFLAKHMTGTMSKYTAEAKEEADPT